jgi:phosphoesterase RecJ-like protein
VEKFYPEFAGIFDRLWSQLGATVAVVGHARPDGDCIGSQVALARVLRAAGHAAVCINADPVPRRLQFLTGEETFLRSDEVLRRGEKYPAIYVDCADHGRAGSKLQGFFPTPLGNIDHHLSNAGYATVNLVDSVSAATCELLAGLFLDRGLTIDAITAQALYTGILTDTGQFRFNSTSQRCFVLAGELVARGANPAEAGYQLYERESQAKLQLLQRYLKSLTLECGGRVCIGLLPDGIYAETGATGEDTEGLVDYARSIEGVEIGVLIEERPGGAVKASLRAKDPICRVDLIAAQFNGGGHACAAGLNLSPAPADFRARLLAALSRRLREIDAAQKASAGA